MHVAKYNTLWMQRQIQVTSLSLENSGREELLDEDLGAKSPCDLTILNESLEAWLRGQDLPPNLVENLIETFQQDALNEDCGLRTTPDSKQV
jgi:hypothetical protein